jgi:hypothetical protein
VTVREAYIRHLLRTRYLQEHCKEALMTLEAAGVVKVDVGRDRRPTRNGKPTLGEDHVVTFAANPFAGRAS